MEEWYRKQEYFCSVRLTHIHAWTEQEIIDIWEYTKLSPAFKAA